MPKPIKIAYIGVSQTWTAKKITTEGVDLQIHDWSGIAVRNQSRLTPEGWFNKKAKNYDIIITDQQEDLYKLFSGKNQENNSDGVVVILSTSPKKSWEATIDDYIANKQIENQKEKRPEVDIHNTDTGKKFNIEPPKPVPTCMERFKQCCQSISSTLSAYAPSVPKVSWPTLSALPKLFHFNLYTKASTTEPQEISTTGFFTPMWNKYFTPASGSKTMMESTGNDQQNQNGFSKINPNDLMGKTCTGPVS